MVLAGRPRQAGGYGPTTDDLLHYPAWVSGSYFDVRSSLGGTTTQAALTANAIYASPIWVPRAGTRVDRIGINVSAAGAASTSARLMVYRATNDVLPGSLILDAGTVAVDSTGDKEITIDLALPAGWIFGAIVSNGAPTLQWVFSTITVYGTATPATVNTKASPNRPFTFGAAPDPWGTPTNYATNSFVRVALRAV